MRLQIHKGIFLVFSILITYLILFWITPLDDQVYFLHKFAVFLGGWAFTNMSLAFLLAARPRILEGPFDGLDRMYKVHKVLGISSIPLILLHMSIPLIPLDGGAAGLATEILPVAPSPGLPLGILAFLLFIFFMFLTLNRKIAYPVWRKSHRLMGVLYFLMFGHFMTIEKPFALLSPVGIFLLIAFATGILSYLYKEFLHPFLAPKHRFKVEKIQELSRATELVLSPVSGTAPLQFEAGQFAFLHFKQKGLSEPHPFTISSAPEEGNLRFTIKVLGDFTRKIRDQLEMGTQAIVEGPYGRFDYRKGCKKQIWVAGGVGITPFLSKARSLPLKTEENPKEITLFYCVRERKEVLFPEELVGLSEKGIKLIVKESNQGEFIMLEDLETLASGASLGLKEYDVFFCGPKLMRESLLKALQKKGFPKKQFHYEEFELR